jgi:hypothetical protein
VLGGAEKRGVGCVKNCVLFFAASMSSKCLCGLTVRFCTCTRVSSRKYPSNEKCLLVRTGGKGVSSMSRRLSVGRLGEIRCGVYSIRSGPERRGIGVYLTKRRSEF